METLSEFMEYEILHIGEYSLQTSMIITAVMVFVFTFFLLWVTKKALFRKAIKNKLDEGNLFSIFQIIKYLVWISSILVVLEVFGIELNVLLAGSAALLVGVGLGLQNTFNNFISGIILLFEGSIKVNDILEVDGDVIRIQQIGLRTSRAINRSEISIIIPNSYITSNKVINWSHQKERTRFNVSVGVAYGSDVELVSRLLRESAAEHPLVIFKERIWIQFKDFGNSSLDFSVYFFSNEIFSIEIVKSDIRKAINQKFVEHKVTIPFPQMDVYVKS